MVSSIVSALYLSSLKLPYRQSSSEVMQPLRRQRSAEEVFRIVLLSKMLRETTAAKGEAVAIKIVHPVEFKPDVANVSSDLMIF